jgi:hypothetical protein
MVNIRQVGLAQCLVTFASSIARPGYSGSGTLFHAVFEYHDVELRQETTPRVAWG